MDKTLELKVGAFIAVGLIIVAIMAVKFGRIGQGLAEFYTITVEFPNASGLVKNADVQLSGARIGVVAEAPQIVAGKIGVVPVNLKIRKEILLPTNSYFFVGSSGLLGDKSVVIGLPPGFDRDKFAKADPKDPKQVIQPGTVLTGTQTADFNELATQGQQNMEKLGEALDEMKATLNRLNSGILSDENMNNLSSSFASLKTTSDNIAGASNKIEDTISDAHDTFESIQQAVTDIRGVVKTVETGPGAIPMLLRNREAADNLNAFLANIRRHGVLFYRNSTETPAARPTPTPSRSRR